jgi:hypothetical protein
VQIAAGKVQWCVPPINVLPTDCQPFPVTVFFLLASISSTRQMCRPLPFATFRSYPGDVLISPWRAISRLSPPTASRGIPSLSTTPSRSKNHPRVHRACACTGPTRPYCAARNRGSPGRAMRDAERRLARASCSSLLPPHHQHSDSIFGPRRAVDARPGRRVPRTAHPT